MTSERTLKTNRSMLKLVLLGVITLGVYPMVIVF